MDEESRPSLRPKGFVGNSESMQKVYAQIAQVAPSATTVFLQGESGTGKELAARAIHAASARAPRPFISLNCAACRKILLKASCSGTSAGPSPEPVPPARAALNWRTAARCFWTKWASFPS